MVGYAAESDRTLSCCCSLHDRSEARVTMSGSVGGAQVRTSRGRGFHPVPVQELRAGVVKDELRLVFSERDDTTTHVLEAWINFGDFGFLSHL